MKKSLATLVFVLAALSHAGPAHGQGFPTPYCEISFGDIEPITRVQFQEIDNTSTGDDDLEDFRAQAATVTIGESHPIIVMGDTVGDYINYIDVFVDWNRDGDFDDASERYEIGEIENSDGDDDVSANGMIDVPGSAAPGSTRMRVVKNYDELGQHCGRHDYGQAEEYTLVVSGDSVSEPVLLSLIADQTSTVGTAFSLDASVHFSDPNDDTLTFSADGLPAGVTIDPETGVIDGTPSEIGDHLVEVKATNGAEESISAAFALFVLSDIVVFPAPYCDWSLDWGVEPISRVRFAGIDNISSAYLGGDSALEDFLDNTASVVPGSSREIVLEGNTGGDPGYWSYYSLYVDWNQDGDFSDDGERYEVGYINDSSGSDGKQVSVFIDIPESAPLGSTRMRVVKQDGGFGNACGYHSYGQAEDYTLTVSDEEVPEPPVTRPRLDSAIADRHVLLDTALTLNVSPHFSDPNDDELSFAASGLPPGLAIDGTTGVISGTPGSLGNYEVEVGATNSGEESVYDTFTLVVDVEREAFAGGDGSEDDPWRITSALQLHAMRDDLTANYVLAADIDLDADPWNRGAGWVPIGTWDEEFRGSFDGGGYTISGLTIDRPEEERVGLFGSAFFATLHKVRLEDVFVTGGDRVGALTGTAGDSVITEAFVSGTVSSADASTEYVGGLVGSMSYSTLVSEASAQVVVSGGDYAGGLVGAATLGGEITDSVIHGTVSGGYATGGLVGYLETSTVSRSHAHADVAASGSRGAGGLIGYAYEGHISESHAEGNVMSDDDFAGGLVGHLTWGSYVGDSYARGSVSGYDYVGGLLGGATGSLVENSYAAASVSGGHVGLVGSVLEATVRDSFWSSGHSPGLDAIGDDDDSGDEPNVIENVAGLSADALRDAETFADAGWDMDIWTVDPAGLPYHTWAAFEVPLGPSPVTDQYLLANHALSLDLAAPFSVLDGHILSFSATGLPAGLDLDEETGLISGATAESGTHDVSVTAHLADASTPSVDFRLFVLNFADGDGSVEDPWQVSSPSQLDEMRRYPHGNFLLSADLDLGGDDEESPFYNASEGWEPIGDETTPFTGSFDGGGHVISGLFIHRNTSAGLFGLASGADFRNVRLEDVAVSGFDFAGALVGYLEDGEIVDSHVSGEVVADPVEGYAGGLAGAVLGGGIDASHFDGRVSGQTAGGLIAAISAGTIRDSYARGEAEGMMSGGLAGLLAQNGQIVDSYASVEVSGFTAGALVSLATEDATGVDASFWDRNAAPALPGTAYDESDRVHAIGLEPTALRDPATFTDAGWDLELTWRIHPLVNDGFPHLRGEGRTADNVPPTFSALAGPAGDTDEDTPVTLTFAAIAALGDQQDLHGGLTEGGIAAFAVAGLDAGSLSIDGAPFHAVDNRLITPTANAVWMPPADAHGLLDAFTLLAVDDEGAESATPVQAQVRVEPVNDAPVLISPIGARSATVGAAFTLDLAAFFEDPDGDALGFGATGLPTGLAIGADGLIEGVPAQAGDVTVKVTATDPALATASDTFVLAVASKPVSPGTGAGVIDDHVSGGNYRGRIVVTPSGVLEGGTADGYIENRGTITGQLILGPGSTVDGGLVSGSLTGHPRLPTRIVNAQIAPGTRLENVIIGHGTTLSPGASIGPNVRFESGGAIPPGIDLSGALSSLRWNNGDEREVVDLDDDVATAPESGILRAIQLLTPFEPSGNDIVQDADGELLLITEDSRSAALPVLVSQADPDAEEGVYVNEDGDIVFVTANRRVLVSHPVLVENAFFIEVMRSMGLNLSFDDRTNLLATPSAGTEQDVRMALFLSVGDEATEQSAGLADAGFYHAARPALSALPAHRHQTEGLYVHELPESPSLPGLTFVFRDESGRLMEQDIVPVPGDWFGLKTTLKSLPGVTDVRISPRGVIAVTVDGRLIQGQAGFRVRRGVGVADPDGAVILRVAGDLNGDGTSDYWIDYPNGDRQNLFILP